MKAHDLSFYRIRPQKAKVMKARDLAFYRKRSQKAKLLKVLNVMEYFLIKVQAKAS